MHKILIICLVVFYYLHAVQQFALILCCMLTFIFCPFTVFFLLSCFSFCPVLFSFLTLSQSNSVFLDYSCSFWVSALSLSLCLFLTHTHTHSQWVQMPLDVDIWIIIWLWGSSAGICLCCSFLTVVLIW